MLTIKTWCLPKLSQGELKKLHNNIVIAVVSIPELDIGNEEEMLNLFPVDAMSYGLGTEISIEITKFPQHVKCGNVIRNKLAEKVGKAVKKMFPSANVECDVSRVDFGAGHWTSEGLNDLKRVELVCRLNKCPRFERMGTPPMNTTNYLCLYSDAFRIESIEEFEAKDVPQDCPFSEEQYDNQK